MNILGYVYEVDTTQREDELGTMGRMNGKTLRIEIAVELNPQQAQSTILHEIIEAINFHLQLHMEHSVIAGMETGLYQALTQNGVDLAPLMQEEE